MPMTRRLLANKPETQEMKVAATLVRRTLLATALAGVAAPRLAFGQGQSEKAVMKIECAFSDHIFTASLYDNPSARDFASMLPLDLTIEDYSNNEKIAYLPRKLTEEASGPFANEAPGDLCYYAPWGDLAFLMRFRASAHAGQVSAPHHTCAKRQLGTDHA